MSPRSGSRRPPIRIVGEERAVSVAVAEPRRRGQPLVGRRRSGPGLPDCRPIAGSWLPSAERPATPAFATTEASCSMRLRRRRALARPSARGRGGSARGRRGTRRARRAARRGRTPTACAAVEPTRRSVRRDVVSPRIDEERFAVGRPGEPLVRRRASGTIPCCTPPARSSRMTPCGSRRAMRSPRGGDTQERVGGARPEDDGADRVLELKLAMAPAQLHADGQEPVPGVRRHPARPRAGGVLRREGRGARADGGRIALDRRASSRRSGAR